MDGLVAVAAERARDHAGRRRPCGAPRLAGDPPIARSRRPWRPTRTRGEYEEFHPYGSTAWWSQDSSIDVSLKRYRYTGMEKDEESSLSRHGVRMYANWLGRWTTGDPLGLNGGINRCAYCRGNPIVRTDVLGETYEDLGPQVRSDGAVDLGNTESDPDYSPISDGAAMLNSSSQWGFSVPKPDWVRDNLDIALGRIDPETYEARWQSGHISVPGLGNIDTGVYAAWYGVLHVARGSYGNLTGAGRQDISGEGAELLGTAFVFGASALPRPGFGPPPLLFSEDPLVDTNVVIQAHLQNPAAVSFLENNRGLISTGRATLYESTRNQGTRAEFNALLQERGIAFADTVNYRDVIAEGARLRAAFKAATPPRTLGLLDSRQLATARLMNIDFATNDLALYKRARDLNMQVSFIDLFPDGSAPSRAAKLADAYQPTPLRR